MTGLKHKLRWGEMQVEGGDGKKMRVMSGITLAGRELIDCRNTEEGRANE